MRFGADLRAEANVLHHGVGSAQAALKLLAIFIQVDGDLRDAALHRGFRDRR